MVDYAPHTIPRLAPGKWTHVVIGPGVQLGSIDDMGVNAMPRACVMSIHVWLFIHHPQSLHRFQVNKQNTVNSFFGQKRAVQHGLGLRLTVAGRHFLHLFEFRALDGYCEICLRSRWVHLHWDYKLSSSFFFSILSYLLQNAAPSLTIPNVLSRLYPDNILLKPEGQASVQEVFKVSVRFGFSTMCHVVFLWMTKGMLIVEFGLHLMSCVVKKIRSFSSRFCRSYSDAFDHVSTHKILYTFLCLTRGEWLQLL